MARTNLIFNPSFEVLADPWVTTSPPAGYSAFSSIVPSTAQSWVGSYCLECVTGVAGDSGMQMAFGTANYVPVSGSLAYRASVYARSDQASSRRVSIGGTWSLSSGGSQAASSTVQSVSNSAWTRLDLSLTSPSTATYLRLWVQFWDVTAIGEKLYLDGLMVEQSSTLGTYFDGDTTDTGSWNYAWTGSAHASTSTATELGTGSISGAFLESGTASGVSFYAPSGLSAVAASGTQIDLNWDAHSEALWYEVERDGVVIARWLTATSYSDTGLTPDTAYSYRVRAVKNHV